MTIHKSSKNNNSEDDTSKFFCNPNFNINLVDAFVAMGGQVEGKGHVNATKLIGVIRDEFQMTIDIEVHF